jgi:large subunit ribosomal protein L25
MKSILIKGSKREILGKKATKALRNAEKVPCVIYGGKEPLHFAVETKALKPLVYTPNAYTADIELDGDKKLSAILQDIQFHPVTDAILHVDFYQLHEDKMVTMNIPVVLEGSSVGIKNGGVLRFPARRLSITCLPKDLPDFITVDISPLKIGDKFLVSDLVTNLDGINVNHPDNAVICQVRRSRAATTVVLDEDEDEDAETQSEETASKEE